ncbi:uncharacterized protein LOC141900195 [Tubulanus polymorphus]|uniref:uncharacterized protein LOC141900195 n=1 Tax=Tubulanus polymorphus TaxID=672921 RepID=UPI003DA52CE4
MVCYFSRIQGPIQAALRPGIWCLCCQFLRCHRERWHLSLSVSEHINQLEAAIEKIQQNDPNSTYQIAKINDLTGFVQIYCYTRAEWLDVMEIDFNTGKVWSFSSGFFPTWVPLCFVLNSLLFFFPFFDWNVNKNRVEAFRTTLGLSVESDQV